jgi:hypothetical protein
MRLLLACVSAAALMVACGPKVEQQPARISEATISIDAQTDAGEAAGAGAAPGFKVEPLGEGEGNVQGCQTMLSNNDGGEIFRASAADNDAPGFVKIDGDVVQVDLVSSDGDEKSRVRTFESADKKTSVVESLVNGEAYPESDSVAQSGSIEITHDGAKQTFEVKGGTAC